MKKTKNKDINSADDEDEAALAEHLKNAHGLTSPEDFDSNYQFTVVQLCDPNTLVDCEYKWIMNLNTMDPFGLNLSKPYGVSVNIM